MNIVDSRSLTSNLKENQTHQRHKNHSVYFVQYSTKLHVPNYYSRVMCLSKRERSRRVHNVLRDRKFIQRVTSYEIKSLSNDSSIETPGSFVESFSSPPKLSRTQIDAYDYTTYPPSPRLLLPLFEDEEDQPKTKFPRFNLRPKIREPFSD